MHLKPIPSATVSVNGTCGTVIVLTDAGNAYITIATPDNLSLAVSAPNFHDNSTWYNYTYTNVTLNASGGYMTQDDTVWLVPFPSIDVQGLGNQRDFLSPLPGATVSCSTTPRSSGSPTPRVGERIGRLRLQPDPRRFRRYVTLSDDCCIRNFRATRFVISGSSNATQPSQTGHTLLSLENTQPLATVEETIQNLTYTVKFRKSSTLFSLAIFIFARSATLRRMYSPNKTGNAGGCFLWKKVPCLLAHL